MQQFARNQAQAFTGETALIGTVFAGVAAVTIVWLGLLWPPYLWWLPLLGGAYWARHALRAGRRTNSWPAAALAPIVNATLDIAHVIGYTAGLIGRRQDAD